MNKDFRYFERPHYQAPVEEPKQQFSAPDAHRQEQ